MEERDYILEIATAIYPQCIREAQQKTAAAKMAIEYAVELLYQREEFKLDSGL